MKKKQPTGGSKPATRTVKEKVQYEIVLYWSAEDQAFIAEVPELPGCAADGATYDEALAAVQIIIQEWIATARELNRPVPRPRRRRISA